MVGWWFSRLGDWSDFFRQIPKWWFCAPFHQGYINRIGVNHHETWTTNPKPNPKPTQPNCWLKYVGACFLVTVSSHLFRSFIALRQSTGCWTDSGCDDCIDFWGMLWVFMVLPGELLNWMGPNPNGPPSVSCNRAIRYTQGFHWSVKRGSDRWRFLGLNHLHYDLAGAI